LQTPAPQLGSSETIPPEENPENTASTTADLAAAAAVSDEPDFPDEPTGPGASEEETEFIRLSHILDQIMTSYKTELDVVTKTGRNPYRLAEDEFKNSAATEETRQAMIDRLTTWLKAKGINV
jgi:hypothetical protein